ncbi:MAG: ABC transporter ATP-binding protein, partial [Deinococcota bacterium]
MPEPVTVGTAQQTSLRDVHPGTAPMLELRDVHTYYGHIHALKGLNLTVNPGEIVALIGGNGAGNT